MSNTEELWQACDERGEPTGSLTREEAWSGMLHLSAHLWIWRRTQSGTTEVLLQRRAANKRTWPEFYDISAAGHVDVGEEPAVAALREADEEIGLKLTIEQIALLFVYHQTVAEQASGLIENEFQKVYGHELVGKFEYAFNDGEVSELIWVTLEQLHQAVREEGSIPIVPQGNAYFTCLFDAIQRREQ